MNELETKILHVVKESLEKAVKDHLSGYSSPLNPIITSIVKEHESDIRNLISEAISGTFADDEVRAEMMKAIKHRCARELVFNFGDGIFKKTMDQLKGESSVRARCVLAVERIVNEELAKGAQK